MSVSGDNASESNRLLDTCRDIVKLAFLFAALVLLCRIFNPSEWQHVVKTSVVIVPILAIFRAAERYGKEDVFPVFLGGQAVVVVLAGLLLAVVPHHPLTDQHNSPFGRLESSHPTLTTAVDDMFIAAVCVLLLLAAISAYIGFRGGGERWKQFAGRYSSLARFTYNLLPDGTVSLLLWLIFSEFVWRLTA